MPQDIYEIKDSRDGQVYELQMDHMPTPEEAKTALAKLRAVNGPTIGPSRNDAPLLGSGGIGRTWPVNGPSERTRVDNSFLGVPPEMAVIGALGVGRAMMAPAANMAGRAVAGAKEVVGQVTPIVKYEATKSTLTHIGVPESIAIPLAMAVSGYRRGVSPTEKTIPELVDQAVAKGKLRQIPPGYTGRGPSTPVTVKANAMEGPPMPVAPASVPEAVPPSAPSAGTSSPPTPSPAQGPPVAPRVLVKTARGTTRAAAASNPPFDLNSLSPEEVRQATKWFDQGVPADIILQRIQASRQFVTAKKSATPAEAAAEVARMVREAAAKRAAKRTP